MPLSPIKTTVVSVDIVLYKQYLLCMTFYQLTNVTLHKC